MRPRKKSLGSVRPTDPVWLADWLEMQVLRSQDWNASRGDLQSWLRIQTAGEDDDPQEGEERLILETFGELERRATAARRAYPFKVSPPLVSLRGDDWRSFSAYVFCLLVSNVGPQNLGRLNAARLFETVATSAAKRYVSGNAEQFAFPRPQLPKAFARAVDEICRKIGEGRGMYEGQSCSKNDDHLDVVAWRPFPDRLPGQIVIFGQCAAGKNWEGKRSELNPKAFWNKWISRPSVSRLVRAFFMPHRVPSEKWCHLGYDAGLVFDRCRIAYWAHGSDEFRQQADWSNLVLRNYAS